MAAKRIKLKVEFTRQGVVVSTFGHKQLPMLSYGPTMDDNPAFRAFNRALHKFGKDMLKAGELI